MTEPTESNMASRLLLALAVPIGTFEAITLFSTFSGELGAGALTGLLLFGGIAAGVAFGMLPKERRHSALAPAAVLVSAIAVVAVLGLAGKIGQAQGALPPGAIVAKSVLLIIFQAGFAATWWLTANRGVRDQSRSVPAAIGVVVLLAGGLVIGGSEPAAEPSASDAAERFDTFPDPEDYAFARETERVGSGEGADFAHYHTGQQPLLGISVSTRDWMSGRRIDGKLRGIFDPATAAEAQYQLLAEPGFAVASVETQAGEHVNALRVEFGPLDGERVSLVDRYWSHWVGGFTPGAETQRIGGDADLVVGLAGSKGLVLNSLGLLVTP